jgi:hypothetical protein
LKPKKIFLLITVFFCLLASSVNAGSRGERVDTAGLNDHFTLGYTKIAAEDDVTNFFLKRNPASFHHDSKKPHHHDGDHDGDHHPPVVPEPVSYLLFIAGGAVLASQRYLKRKK